MVTSVTAILRVGALIIGAGAVLRFQLQGSAPQLVAERVLRQGLQSGSRLCSPFQEPDTALWALSLNPGERPMGMEAAGALVYCGVAQASRPVPRPTSASALILSRSRLGARRARDLGEFLMADPPARYQGAEEEWRKAVPAASRIQFLSASGTPRRIRIPRFIAAARFDRAAPPLFPDRRRGLRVLSVRSTRPGEYLSILEAESRGSLLDGLQESSNTTVQFPLNRIKLP